MKKLSKSSELLWLFGILFVALGVAMCSKADLGVSMIAAPAFIVYEAISPLWSGFSVGMVEYMIQGVLLAAMCIAVGRFNWRYLLAFWVAVLYGYALNLFLLLLDGVNVQTAPMRWVMLIAGDVVTAFGVACFFRTYMPLQVFELFVAEIAGRFDFQLQKTKQIFDYSLLALSAILALTLFGDVTAFDWMSIGYASYHSIGLGTIVTTLINSPLIAMMGKLIDRFFDPMPRFSKLEAFLKR